MNRWRNILFILLFAFIFIEVILFFPHRVEQSNQIEDKQKKLLEKNQGPEQRMKKIQVVESQKGNRDWELFAEAAEGSQDQAIWHLQNVKVQFYSFSKIEYVVTGDRGQIEGKTKNMTIEGNVITRSANGYEFKSEQVFYLSAERKINTPGAVIMTGPKDTQGEGLNLTGNIMTVFIDTSLIKIQSQVKASKVLTGDRRVAIESDSAEFSGHSHEANFIGNVIMNYEGMDIRGPNALFSYKAGTNILKSIFMKGGVNAKDDEKTAKAENLTADILNEKIFLRGQPSLMQNEDVLNGDEIVFLEGGKKVKVERVKSRVEITK